MAHSFKQAGADQGPLYGLYLILLSLSLVVYTGSCHARVGGRTSGWKAAQVRGMFVFGSSLVDNGNNKYVRNSSARADYLPYGIDFDGGPSGRFSNGRNPVDVLGQLLKFPRFLLPFNDPRARGKRVLHGVNFASGGSGILDDTGSIAGRVVNLKDQISNFEGATLAQLRVGLDSDDEKLSIHLSKSLFVIGTGGNDYLLNYFSRPHQMNITDFTITLVNGLSAHIKRLYAVGGRKFVILSIQVMGCIPMIRSKVDQKGTCNEPLNQVSLLFNSHLKSMVQNIGSELHGSNLVFVNSYQIMKDIIDNPRSKGITEVIKSCCQTNAIGILCKEGLRACQDRDAHVYFDGLHPTDTTNVWIAKAAYSSTSPSYVFPVNVSQLALL